MAEQQPQHDARRRPVASSQPTVAELLLEMPRDDEEFERLPVKARDVTFD